MRIEKKQKRIWPRFFSRLSMLFVLRASCLSKHICISAGLTWLFSSVCLSSALSCAWSQPPPSTDSMNLMLRIVKLIKPTYLVLHLTTLSWKLGSAVSVVHTTASFPQSIIELPSVGNDVSLLLLTCTSKPLVCFEECVNQIDWHQPAFHWVQNMREPLKIAQLFCNELL